MAWVDVVLAVVLLEYLFFIGLVGRARGRYGIQAPATSGHPVFERWLRVQGNTLELLIMFVPALWGAARYWKPEYVAAVGAVFIAGRAMYAAGYVQAPEKRSMGFLVSFVPVVVLVLATAIGAVRSLL